MSGQPTVEGEPAMAVAERDLEQPLEHEIDPQLQAELLKHPGKWVAITRSELLAVSADAAEAYRLARDKGFEAPILYRVPDAATAYFF